MKQKEFISFCVFKALFTFSNVAFLILIKLTIYRLTQSGLGLSTLTLIQQIPLVCIGPFAGIIVDKFKKRNLEIICLFSLAIILVIMDFAESLWTVYVLVFCYMFIWTFLKPAILVSIYMLSSNQNLVASNSLLMIIGEIVTIIGATMIAYLGDGKFIFKYYYLSFCMLLSVIFVFLAHRLEQNNITHATKKGQENGLIEDFRSGWRYFFGNKQLFILAIIVAMIWLSIGSYTSIQLIYLVKELLFPDHYLGYVNSVSSFGSIVGYLAAPLLIRCVGLHKHHVFAYGYFIAGITFIFFLFYKHFIGAMHFFMTILFIQTVAYGASNTIEEALEQELPVAGHKGKVISFISSIGTFGYLIGTLVAPILTDFINSNYVLMLSMACFLITYFLIKKYFLKDVT